MSGISIIFSALCIHSGILANHRFSIRKTHPTARMISILFAFRHHPPPYLGLVVVVGAVGLGIKKAPADASAFYEFYLIAGIRDAKVSA